MQNCCFRADIPPVLVLSDTDAPDCTDPRSVLGADQQACLGNQPDGCNGEKRTFAHYSNLIDVFVPAARWMTCVTFLYKHPGDGYFLFTFHSSFIPIIFLQMSM